jgi:hypothetical protein
MWRDIGGLTLPARALENVAIAAATWSQRKPSSSEAGRRRFLSPCGSWQLSLRRTDQDGWSGDRCPAASPGFRGRD